MGAIVPGALYLDTNPMDSPLWVLDGVGNPMISSGYSLFVELVGYDIAAGHTVTLYYATDGYSDPSAPAYFEPRMTQALNFRRDLFSGNTTGGAGRVSYGELRLANSDGGLDDLRTEYAFAGWPARFLIGDPSLAYNTFEALVTGKPQQAFFTTTEVQIMMRDRLQDLAQPCQLNKYLGNNVLPNGLEGNKDLKDKLKPVLYGRVTNIPPILVNSAKLIYQVNDGSVGYLPAVYDKGVLLNRAFPDYVSQADMIANQPAGGTYRVLVAEGYFRLGGTPVGSVTCDAADIYTIDGTERDIGNTAAQVAKRIVIRPAGDDEGGLLDTDIDAGDVAAMDIACKQVVGVWAADDASYSQLLDAVLGSVGAWYQFDRFDKFRMQRLEPPTGAGVCNFKMFGSGGNMGDAGLQDFDIIDVRFLPTNDPDRGIPSWEIELKWGRNYVVQDDDNILGATTTEHKDYIALDYRTAKAQNLTLKDIYPLAISKKVTTVLIDGTDAQNEANRLLAIYQDQRDFLEIDTPLTSELIATVDIGKEVKVILPRFEYAAGRSMRVIGMQYNPGTRGCTLSLWS